MLINNVKFIAQSTEPNPNEVDYWINTSVDPNGGLIMFHDGETWHPVNEKHDLFQEKLIREEVERAKAAEAVLDQKINTETNRAITAEAALLDEMNSRIIHINTGEYNKDTYETLLDATNHDVALSVNGNPAIYEGSSSNTIHIHALYNYYRSKQLQTGVNVYNFENDGTYTKSSYIISFTKSGDGTKFLADDGSYKQLESSTTSTSVASLPITSNMVIATISAASSFSLNSTPAAGKEIHVIIKNSSTSDVTVTLPTASPYVCISSDSLTVPASGYAEVNAISDGTNIYLRAL